MAAITMIIKNTDTTKAMAAIIMIMKNTNTIETMTAIIMTITITVWINETGNNTQHIMGRYHKNHGYLAKWYCSNKKKDNIIFRIEFCIGRWWHIIPYILVIDQIINHFYNSWKKTMCQINSSVTELILIIFELQLVFCRLSFSDDDTRNEPCKWRHSTGKMTRLSILIFKINRGYCPERHTLSKLMFLIK